MARDGGRSGTKKAKQNQITDDYSDTDLNNIRQPGRAQHIFAGTRYIARTMSNARSTDTTSVASSKFQYELTLVLGARLKHDQGTAGIAQTPVDEGGFRR